MKKVFISGPMRGIPNWNVPAFNEAEAKLKELGFAVFNPAWLQFDPDAWTHEEIIKIDFAALESCDYMLRLPGWENSRGATEENEHATKLYMGIYDNIEDIPVNDAIKYKYDDLMAKEANGELDFGRYETCDCPVCHSTEHGGLVIKYEDGKITTLTESEECANSQKKEFNIMDLFSNLSTDDGEEIDISNMIPAEAMQSLIFDNPENNIIEGEAKEVIDDSDDVIKDEEM